MTRQSGAKLFKYRKLSIDCFSGVWVKVYWSIREISINRKAAKFVMAIRLVTWKQKSL